MQIMVEKGLLTRDASVAHACLRGAVPQDQTQRLLVADLVDRAFGGSARRWSCRP